MSKFQLILLDSPVSARAGQYLLIGDGKVVVKTSDQIDGMFNGHDASPTRTPDKDKDISVGSFRRLRVLTRENEAFERRLWLFDQVKTQPGGKLGSYIKLLRALHPTLNHKQASNFTARDLNVMIEAGMVRREGKAKNLHYFPATGVKS